LQYKLLYNTISILSHSSYSFSWLKIQPIRIIEMSTLCTPMWPGRGWYRVHFSSKYVYTHIPTYLICYGGNIMTCHCYTFKIFTASRQLSLISITITAQLSPCFFRRSALDGVSFHLCTCCSHHEPESLMILSSG